MWFLRCVCSISLILHLSPSASPQQATVSLPQQRDPVALNLLQRSIAAMGGTIPLDSVATGTIRIVAGSSVDDATIRILTRGTDQTSEEVHLSQGTRALTYSRGIAEEKTNGISVTLSLESMLTSQSLSFPLPFLSGAVSNPDEALQFVGTEDLNGQQLNHIRLWNTFTSKPSFQHLAEFTVADLWLDVTSGLPHRISVTLREGGGSSPRIPLEVYFSDYRSVGGVLYPFLTQKSLNGTPWMTITISSVSLNTGLTDASFRVQ